MLTVIVTFPLASSGTVTVIVALSPTYIGGASIWIPASFFFSVILKGLLTDWYLVSFAKYIIAGYTPPAKPLIGTLKLPLTINDV